MQLQVFLLVFLLEFHVLIKSINTFENADIEECLTDLSISELLRLKRSLERMEEEGSFPESFWKEETINQSFKEEKISSKPKSDDETCTSQNCLKPMAMALTGVPRGFYGHSGHHHSHHPWQPEEKQSKLTTLFNITITALSFLAFGGYLLCLIVHAIKSKGATYFYPVTTAATTAVDGGIRKIKVYRRGRRAIKQQPFTTYSGEFYTSFGATVMSLRN